MHRESNERVIFSALINSAEDFGIFGGHKHCHYIFTKTHMEFKTMKEYRCNFYGVFANMVTLAFILFLITSSADRAMGQNNSSPAPVTNQTTPPPPLRSLNIAIPVKSGFKEMISIDQDNITGEQNFNGFSIEVFNAVINTALTNPPSVKFVPFANPDGSMNGTYDDMLQAVFSQKYDGAIGDITIRFYRTEWVDFTLPYSETGVSMLVSVSPQQNKSSRIALMPLIKGLVLATLAFCFISALVFWFVEFKNDKRQQVALQSLGANPEPQHENSDEKWRRETLRAIVHTRLVMVMWFLVLLLVTSCYMASWTSMLKAQRPRVAIRSLNQLIRNREKVGYQKGSFVRNLLTQTGFSEDQLQVYSTEEEMLNLLSPGPGEGGVAAVVDETPYLKLFLARHCNGPFTLVPSVNFHADGFGFAFQRGSAIVQEISNGILNVIDDGKLAEIQDRTIGDLETCQSSDGEESMGMGADSSNLILLDSETSWILFAGALGVGLVVVILYLVYFGTICGVRSIWVAYPCYLLRQRNHSI